MTLIPDLVSQQLELRKQKLKVREKNSLYAVNRTNSVETYVIKDFRFF